MPRRVNRYGAWRGGPDPLAPPYDVRAAVDQVGREVLAGGSLRDALRDLLRRGTERGRGLDELLRKTMRRRQEAMRRGDLDGSLTRASALLDQALAAEREELAQRDDEEARFAEARLDSLPRSTARAVEELADYDWASPTARQAYEQILAQLRREVLDQRFEGIRDALQGADPAHDPAAAERLRDMLHDLNALLAKHARGEDTADAFDEFMQQHGEFFPEQPRTVDELIDLLAQRAAQGERLLRSLSPDQRDELARLMAQAFGQAGIADEMSALGDNLRSLRPDLPWGRGESVSGDQPLGYGDATGVLGELSDLDELIEQLAQEHPGATLDDIDVDTVQRTLGRGAADEVRRLQQLERELTQRGWVTRDPEGLTLSPKALRRLGESALREVFADLRRGRPGQHDQHDAGSAGEPTGASRAWAFGDEQPLDAVRTIGNALRREAAARHPSGGGVVLAVEDFEVVETERLASAAVALCVDLSYSMFAEGRWGPMKQTALALAHLVATRFPQDALQIIGFGRYALPLSVRDLAAVEPDFVQGTNLHHALQLAGRHVRRHPESEPVVLVVTDGEPTAHLVGAGETFFSWPPAAETVQATVAEVDLLTRFGATLNVFMLGEDDGLRRFVDAVARRNGGRVLSPSPEDLSKYVVTDYLRMRSRHR